MKAGEIPRENSVTALALNAVPPHEDDNITLVLHLSDAVNYKWDNDDFSDNDLTKFPRVL